MLNWKDINYAKGINRLYNAIWAIYATLYSLLLITGNLDGAAEYLAFPLVLVGPFLFKLFVIWIWKGFTEK